MKTSTCRVAIFCGCLLTAASLRAASPRVFFSDLESGPNVGGENNAGAWVTIYGKDFGQTQETSYVTVGGGRAAAYRIWTDGKIAFQLGDAAKTGEIVVTAKAGTSRGIPFTVRPGNIYFVASDGKDSHKGTFASPWHTLLKARNSVRPGDIAYAMNGVMQASDDGEGWNAALTLRGQWCGSRDYPRAFVAYPGATAVIGSSDGPPAGIRGTDSSAGGGPCAGSWLFAGFTLRGKEVAVAIAGPSHAWRFVANDLSCPEGDGPAACFVTGEASNVKFFGNNVHEAGKYNASALYHGVYFSTDSNHIDMGWNTVANVHGCRGVQVHSTRMNSNSGYNQYDVKIHDNVIHDTQCDGIVLATVDPSKGPVEVYNNLIYNAGKGPDNPERNGNWSCIEVVGYTNNGSSGGGTVQIFNNTMYNCGSFEHPPYERSRAGVMNGGHDSKLNLQLTNNIIYQIASGAPYVLNLGTAKGIYGTNNLLYGIGPESTMCDLADTVTADPLFVNASRGDFHLKAGSPARGRGIRIGLSTDKDRAEPDGTAGYYIGAFAP